MFEHYGHIHLYGPRAGKDEPLGSIVYQNHKYSVHLSIFCTFFPSNNIVTVFPIQMPGFMIYINFVEIETLMLGAKFQDPRLCGTYIQNALTQPKKSRDISKN